MVQTTETIIVGGGLACVSLALSLVEAGVDGARVTVVDAGDERAGSRCPATMLHAFPGRRMSFRRGQDDAFVRSWAKLMEWKEELGGHWIRQAPMVRPLMEDDRGRRLRNTWEESRREYPALLESEEMGPEQLCERFAGLDSPVPALVYGPAAGVRLSVLVEALRSRVEKMGVKFVDAAVEVLDGDGAGWSLGLSGGDPMTAERVILAVGPGLADFFSGLDLRKRAGELAIFDPGDATLEPLLNAAKHIFERHDGLWGLGSTYFAVDEWEERDDAYVLERLKAGVRDVLPAIDDAQLVELWRGVRGVFGSDHMPLVGPVPCASGLYTFAAFGSKGLLWAPASAEDLARFLVDGAEDAINPHMDSRRMSADKWVMVKEKALV